MKRKLLLYLCLATLTQCSKCKQADPTPQPPTTQLDLLPPETQTGQRTFGCLVNGQAWTPAGSPLGGPLFSSGYSNQTLYLTANRAVIVDGANITQRIQIQIDNISLKGAYLLDNATSRSAEFSERERQCFFITGAAHPATVEITRLDLVNRIVSGRFAFTLETPGCGKVIVTDGRFDSRF